MTPDGKLLFESALAVGVCCLALGVSIRRKETAPRNWLQRPGTIISSTSRQEAIRPGQYQVVPIIEYEFEYQGKIIRSSHWRVGNFSVGNSEAATVIMSRYNSGAAVTVYVNPKNPTASVVEHSTTPLNWIPLAFGLTLILLSLLPWFEK